MRRIHALFAVAGLVALTLVVMTPVRAQVSTPSISDLTSLLGDLTATGTTDTGTDDGTTPTDPTAPTEGGRSPLSSGLNNVTAGSLGARAPGGMIQQAVAVHTGAQEIPGDADQFEDPSFVRETAFAVFEALFQSLEQGITQTLGSALLGAGLGSGLFGPGDITVGDPLDNQSTLGSGMVIMLP